MAQPADTGSKKLIGLSPITFVQWALSRDDVTAGAPLDQEFQWITRRTDALIPVRSADLGEFLVPTELLLRYNANAGRRVRAYAGLAEEKHALPTYPVLIVMLPPGEGVEISDRYESAVLGKRAVQEFHLIKLWEMDVEAVFERPLPTLLPFAPLMRGGANELAVRRAVLELQKNPDLADLEPVLAALAGYVMSPEAVREIVRWDMSLVRDNPFIEELKQSWLQEGREEGRQEGEAAVILRQLEQRFGPLDDEVRIRVLTADATTLLRWAENILVAGTLQAVLD